MKNYLLHEGPLPGDVSMQVTPSIFNEATYLSLHPVENTLSFFLIEAHRRTVRASIYFSIVDKIAMSPFRAPFGSVDCAADINQKTLYDFLKSVEERLRSAGIKRIRIKNHPRNYNEKKISLIETFLINDGYKIESAELSALVRIRKTNFDSLIKKSEASRLKKANSLGFSFCKKENLSFSEVYKLIASWYKERSYQLSITEDDLRKAFEAMPDRYFIFVVEHDREIVSAAISILVYPDILYNFMSSHAKRLNDISPSVFLMGGIYDYCKENRIRMLDLGTSALSSQPNFPLLDFKLRIGGQPSAKMSFEKDLS